MTTTSLSINQGQTRAGNAKIRTAVSDKEWNECYLVLKGNYLFAGCRGDTGISGRPDQMIIIAEDSSVTGGSSRHPGEDDAFREEDDEDEFGERPNSIAVLSMQMGINTAMTEAGDDDDDRDGRSMAGRDSMKEDDGLASDTTLRIEDAHGQVWGVTFDHESELEDWSTVLRDTIASSQLLSRYPQLLRTVQEGGNFNKKHFQTGTSIFGAKKDAPRFVQVSHDCTAVTWQKVENGEKVKEEYDEIKVADITKVVRGAETDAFKRLGAKKVNTRLCFSVVSGKRTLDLVAASEEERDMWVSALQAVAKFGTGYGGLDATKKALEDRGDQLLRIVEKATRLREAAEDYRDNTNKAKAGVR